MADARAAGGADEAAPWHKRLFYYLDWLFQRDNAAGAEFAALQVRARRVAPVLNCMHGTAKLDQSRLVLKYTVRCNVFVCVGSCSNPRARAAPGAFRACRAAMRWRQGGPHPTLHLP